MSSEQLADPNDNFLTIKQLNPQTFESIERGLVRRRDAIYQANMHATRALEPLADMPHLFKNPRRNRTGKLLPPIECECTEAERDDLACVLWQEERREVWLQQQVKMCSALLRRLAVTLSAIKKKGSSIRIRSVQGARRGSIRKASFIQARRKNRQERSCLGLLLRPFRWVRRVLLRYFSVNSRDAKQEKVSQQDRVAKLDKPLAGLFCSFCIGPGFLLVYHRVEPFENAVEDDAGFSSLRTSFYWWNCLLLLTVVYPLPLLTVVCPLHPGGTACCSSRCSRCSGCPS